MPFLHSNLREQRPWGALFLCHSAALSPPFLRVQVPSLYQWWQTLFQYKQDDGKGVASKVTLEFPFTGVSQGIPTGAVLECSILIQTYSI